MAKLINLTEGMRFGAGIDSLTEEVRGFPIVFDSETDNHQAQKVDASLRMIESQESLMQSMDLSVSASVRYGAANGDVKFNMSLEKSVNQYSLYLLLSASVRNSPRYMVNPRLTPAADELYRRSPEEFRSLYGESYIDEIYSGGDFYGLFVFETFDERSRTDLQASLRASVGNCLAGGKISASFHTAIEDSKKKSRMEIRAIMSGGVGLENPSNLEELEALYKSFNQKVYEHGVDYKASIKELKYLPLPPGNTFAEEAVRRDTISTSGKRIVEAIRTRGDIDFILRFPTQFENPDIPALKAAYEQIDAMLPTLALRARDCAVDLSKCSLAGIAPITIELPKRLVNAGAPLEVKWEDVLAHDSRAKGWLTKEDLQSPLADYDRGPRGGRYKLFVRDGKPVGGIFWQEDIGAHVVYGAIMQEYLRNGHCEGHFGYPRSDEAALTGLNADNLDRISLFEHGVLWWDAQTGKISDKAPYDPLATVNIRDKRFKLTDVIARKP